MTVPLDTRNDIRSMDADGVPRAEIARRLRVSRNTVAKYADMEDMSPAAPVPARRERPALGEHAGWVESVLEADLGAPRKQRHTARRIYDRLVEERGYAGSYSTVQRFVREWRLARSAGAGEGYLELEWAPGTCQVDFGNFRAVVAGEELTLKLLVATLPHSNDRQCFALRSQRSECLCAGLAAIFSRWGRAPRVLVLDNATEAGRMVRGEVTESGLFSLFRGHYRVESRYCNPYSGNEKGSVENAVGYLRRNLLVPVPRVGSLAELNALLAEGCARLNAAAGCRDGRASAEALREDLAEMKKEMMGDVYHLLVTCLGEPPASFGVRLRDKDGRLALSGTFTPLEFFSEAVGMNVDDYVSLISAPTADKPYHKTYTIRMLGNVVGGRKVKYLNLPSEELKKLAIAQLSDGQPVWFGCDVGQMLQRDLGIMGMKTFDYESLLNVHFGMNKAQRLDYATSLMTHAMVFLGVNLVDGKPTRWKVENSWSEKSGQKGYYLMTDEWFDEYNYQIVVNRKYLTPEMQKAFEQEPIVLKPWDPMGSLA